LIGGSPSRCLFALMRAARSGVIFVCLTMLPRAPCL
jgi:hypothetical protein